MVKVLNAGFYSTVQDLGRVGFQEFGVPYSGVMDMYSASLANHILGNKENAAVIEMTMTGATLQFACETVICIAGADMVPKLNDVPIRSYNPVKVQSGDVLSFGRLTKGFRCYLAVMDGFETEVVMGSRSMYKGIATYFKLSKNDELIINLSNSFTGFKNASIKVKDYHFSVNKIEAFKGPEFDRLSKNQQVFLLQNQFTISKENNRMAYQLSEPLENSLKPIITSAVLPGTVQLTPSGKLIILMRDCQTTGGYPRVLQLKESAISILAQKFTGNSLNFEMI